MDRRQRIDPTAYSMVAIGITMDPVWPASDLSAPSIGEAGPDLTLLGRCTGWRTGVLFDHQPKNARTAAQRGAHQEGAMPTFTA